MSLKDIKEELEKMGVSYQTRLAPISEVEEIQIPMLDVSASKARQIEYMCTSNGGIVSKDSTNWIIQNL